jgi:hypothetical protein
LVDKAVQSKIYDWVSGAEEELKEREAAFNAYLKDRNAGFEHQATDEPQSFLVDRAIVYRYGIINGFIFINIHFPPIYTSGYGLYDSYVYDYETAAFDLYTGEKLEFSDLFFHGEDFMPQINSIIQKQAGTVTSGGYRPVKREFAGLQDNGFGFFYDYAFHILLPAENPYFSQGVDFAFGFESFDGVIWLKRDMEGLFVADIDFEIYESPVRYGPRIKTEQYFEDKVLIELLLEYEDIPKEKLDAINLKMLDMLRSGDFADFYRERYGEEFKLGAEYVYNPDSVYSSVRHTINAGINSEYGYISLGEWDFGWYLDFDTLEELDLLGLAAKVFGKENLNALKVEFEHNPGYGTPPGIDELSVRQVVYIYHEEEGDGPSIHLYSARDGDYVGYVITS